MAVWDTLENQRSALTCQTYNGLLHTVDFRQHRLVVVDNASTDEKTWELLREIRDAGHTVISNPENRGTALAINRGWQLRRPGEHCVKMDNDVVIRNAGWADLIEEVFRRSHRIGICGLKRKDLDERPDHPGSWYRSTLQMLPHEAGQLWIVVERVNHVMGTCQAYSSALLDQIGYLYQLGGLYGFDDALAAERCRLAGYLSVFLPHIEIDHIDPGGTEYTTWKQVYAGQHMAAYQAALGHYQDGSWSLWHNPDGSNGRFSWPGSSDGRCP
jgi:glycosyltransferase involved in cell wall biosynthesis